MNTVSKVDSVTITKRKISVAIVGNPNVGKTSLSNYLSGSRDSVANYPRVTVSKKENIFEYKGWTIHLVDLPGVYSLTSQLAEERAARDFIQDNSPDVILNVLDAGTLDRSLFLTTQLIEMARPRVHALNMIDEARKKHHQIDTKTLSEMLGGPVVEMNSIAGEGIEALLDAILETASASTSRDNNRARAIPYDTHLEEAILRVQEHIAELHPGMLQSEQSRWLAIKLLEGDDELLLRESDHGRLMDLVTRESANLASSHGEEPGILISNSRYGFIHGLLSEARVIYLDPSQRMNQTRAIDKVLLHQTFGMPIFLGLMWLMFEVTFTLGNYPMDWIDAVVAFISENVRASLPAGMLRDIIVDGAIAGVGGTIIFLPNIVILFFFLAFFSESGYLSRSAFLLDRVMHTFGLHGKAFIPLVMGFGCNVPAIMATRTIESQQSRLISIMVSPFMACTARLPVFILFAGAFFAEWAGTMVFVMYMLSIIVAMGASIFLSKTFIKGENEAFVMELPPYRVPTLKRVIFHMWEKAREFLKKVAGIILVGSVFLWVMQEFPRDVHYSVDYQTEIASLEAMPASEKRDTDLTAMRFNQSQEHLEKSYLGRISLMIAPVFEPLGFTWKDTVAILTGIVAKEVVIASYSVIYAQGGETTEDSTSLREAIAGSMSPLIAFAFMVFALLYAPCLATISVIKREAGGWHWVGFSVAFSFTLAWILAFGIVQIGGISV